MTAFRLLIVEDNEADLATCRDTVARYMDQNTCEVELVECKSVNEAFEKLDNSFDGAIIDLKLGDQGDEGSQVVAKIQESHLRIPVAILTGTPGAADLDFAYIGVFKKGESGAGYADLLDIFWGIHNTGLTRIMGGRGIIEKTLDRVFQDNLLPQRDKWVVYGKTDSERTEKALLRHALNHLLQLLDEDGERFFPEEMYLSPPLTDKFNTGSIVKQEGGNLFVLMTPACDLVVRGGGKVKTDRILLVEIENEDTVVGLALTESSANAKSTELKPDAKPTELKPDAKRKKLKTVFGNSFTAYYHWLPRTDFFAGGFLNFRKLSSYEITEFERLFEKPFVQISPPFVKDVVARFSSYYARQGQPDIEFDSFLALMSSAGESKV